MRLKFHNQQVPRPFSFLKYTCCWVCHSFTEQLDTKLKSTCWIWENSQWFLCLKHICDYHYIIFIWQIKLHTLIKCWRKTPNIAFWTVNTYAYTNKNTYMHTLKKDLQPVAVTIAIFVFVFFYLWELFGKWVLCEQKSLCPMV